MMNPTGKQKSSKSMMDHAWFIFERDFVGDPTIHWIEIECGGEWRGGLEGEENRSVEGEGGLEGGEEGDWMGSRKEGKGMRGREEGEKGEGEAINALEPPHKKILKMNGSYWNWQTNVNYWGCGNLSIEAANLPFIYPL